MPWGPHDAPVMSPEALTGPVAIPGYRDLVEVARGGASVVYRAWQPGPDRPVAIKVLTAAGPDAAERFGRELSITVALGRQHPHIVGVLDGGVDPAGRPYLVMEFYDRGSLHDRLRAGGPLPVADVVAAGIAVADALAFAHGQGVLHGDVKPQNVLVRPTSYVLADFGLARRVLAEHAADGYFSYRHAAPQVLDGAPPTAADDVYSLGSTLHTLLAGQAPFAADDPAADTALSYLRRARTTRPRPVDRPDLPAKLADLVARCLARERADRYPDAATVRDTLAAIRAAAPAPAPVLPSPRRSPDLGPEHGPQPAPAEPAPAEPAPRQLPADVSGFVGRAAQLHALDELLPGPGRPAGLVVAAITGAAGVGKTALAVHWAHRVADRFPDGQLFVNLRAYDPEPAAELTEVLGQLLRSLGVPAGRIPPGLDERSALYRSLLSGRRVLVLLDNAVDAAQVRPLLPGSAGCLVLVTGRDRLGGLAARDGARRLSLEVLSPAESLLLLRAALGPARVAAEPAAAAEVAALCGHLPVALRVAAANLADRPHQTLTGYAATLRSGDRLTELTVDGAEEDGVRAAFELSYRRLTPDARRLYRLLGLHPGPDLEPYAAAALAGLQVDRAGRLLDRLGAAYLLGRTAAGRYHFHDLLRADAADRAAAEDPPAERDAALRRLLDWYRYAADRALGLARPYGLRLVLDLPEPPAPAPELTGIADAEAFLDAERSNLVAAVRFAAGRGFDAHAWQLPHILWRYFELRGHLDDWLATAELGLAAAERLGDRQAEAGLLHSLAVVHRRTARHAGSLGYDQRALARYRELGDRRGEAATLNSLGTTHKQLGHNVEAGELLRTALASYRDIGDRWGEASVLGNLGNACRALGDYDQTREHYQRALELLQELGDYRNAAGNLGNLGQLYRLLGDYPAAAEHIRRAIAVYRTMGDRLNEARALGNLGTVEHRLGRYGAAAEHHQRSLALLREIGDRVGQAESLGNLGAALHPLGRSAEATQAHRQALALVRDIGDRNLESEIRNHCGLVCRETGQPAAALDHHRQALALAEATGNRYEQARAHEGVARARPIPAPAAEAHLRAALARYAELGVPEAAALRAELRGSAAAPDR